MKRFVRAGLLAGVIGLCLAPTAVDADSSGGGERVDVCHFQPESGGWKLLSLPAGAAAAHLAHGDGVPFGVVPGMTGFTFDEACEPVPLRTVYVVGPETAEQDLVGINAALDVLTATAGVPSVYIGDADFQLLIEEALATGLPPTIVDPDTGAVVPVDIMIVPPPGSIPELADAGLAVPATGQTQATVEAGWPADWVALGTYDGTLYGVPNKSDLKSLVWYRPESFTDPGGAPYSIPTTFAELLALTDSIIANGQTPWCVGNDAGAATGFVFTDWVEDRVLGSEPPSAYDDWIANDIGFTDPRIRAAWNDVVDLWNKPGAVFEGLGTSSPGVGITQTSFVDSAFNFAFGDCLMHKQANYLASFIPASLLDELAVFRFPADDAADDPLLIAGTLAVAFSDDVEVSLVHEFFGTVEYADARQAATIPFGQPTGFLSAVAGQEPSLRSPLELAFTDLLINADNSRFDASDLMPPDVGSNPTGTGFWGEGTRAAVTPGNSATVGTLTFVGTTVAVATQNVEDIFCTVAPGEACP